MNFSLAVLVAVFTFVAAQERATNSKSANSDDAGSKNKRGIAAGLAGYGYGLAAAPLTTYLTAAKPASAAFLPSLAYAPAPVVAAAKPAYASPIAAYAPAAFAGYAAAPAYAGYAATPSYAGYAAAPAYAGYGAAPAYAGYAAAPAYAGYAAAPAYAGYAAAPVLSKPGLAYGGYGLLG